nr:hypothetical protein [Tanacetum cinerariifolium]
QSEVSSVESTTNKFLQAPHHHPFLKQLVDVFDHAMSYFLLQCAPSSLWQVLHVDILVMRKHGYGYLKEIMVKRADNKLYKFKEGDFPRLRINDIEDMLLLVVSNRLINLSEDDVADFKIALRMFTKSLVIQKRVEDL